MLFGQLCILNHCNDNLIQRERNEPIEACGHWEKYSSIYIHIVTAEKIYTVINTNFLNIKYIYLR